MKKSLIVLLVAAAISVPAFLGVAQAQKAKEVRYVSSEKASYKEMAGGGPSMHVLRGDPDKGPHATFTKFTPGYDAGMHTHTNDVSCVVIKGAYLYKDDAGEKRVGPGEYIFIPAATNTGAAATKPKELCFIRKAPASSTLYRQNSQDRQHRGKSGDEFRRGPTNSVLVCFRLPGRREGVGYNDPHRPCLPSPHTNHLHHSGAVSLPSRSRSPSFRPIPGRSQ